MDKPAKYQGFSAIGRARAAFECLAAGDAATAARVWLKESDASGAVTGYSTGNAQIVDAANAALGAILTENRRQASESLARAAGLVDQTASALIATASVPRASSSSHHFRLASRNPEAFAKASVARHRGLYAIMRGIIAHHDALLLGGGACSCTRPALLVAIEDTFGVASIEARLMRSETPSEFAECYCERAEKLRAVTRYAPLNAELTPELALAAIGIMPFLPTTSHKYVPKLEEHA